MILREQCNELLILSFKVALEIQLKLRILIKNFETQKKNFFKIFANFEGRICLTSDIWTSLTHITMAKS